MKSVRELIDEYFALVNAVESLEKNLVEWRDQEASVNINRQLSARIAELERNLKDVAQRYEPAGQECWCDDDWTAVSMVGTSAHQRNCHAHYCLEAKIVLGYSLAGLMCCEDYGEVPADKYYEANPAGG